MSRSPTPPGLWAAGCQHKSRRAGPERAELEPNWQRVCAGEGPAEWADGPHAASEAPQANQRQSGLTPAALLSVCTDIGRVSIYPFVLVHTRARRRFCCSLRVRVGAANRQGGAGKGLNADGPGPVVPFESFEAGEGGGGGVSKEEGFLVQIGNGREGSRGEWSGGGRGGGTPRRRHLLMISEVISFVCSDSCMSGMRREKELGKGSAK